MVCEIPREELERVSSELVDIASRLIIKHGCKASEVKRLMHMILDWEV